MKEVLPPAAMAAHIAVVGMTGSGKSSTSRVVVEHGYELGEHICILDTVKSDWHGIVSDFDGTGPGLPFQILGGPYGHVPLHANAGAQIAQLVAHGELPYSIIDMAGFPMGGMHKFYNDFVPVLMQEMRGRGILRLVVEEAHELAPKEKVGVAGENIGVYNTKKLATAGRSLGLRMLFATQRVQALHNAVLGSCSTVIAHRMQFPADQAPVVKWLSGAVKDKKRIAEIEESMSELRDGEAWVCSGIAKLIERQQMPRMWTFDSGKTPVQGVKQQKPVVQAKVDVAKLRDLIGTVVTEVATNDVKVLKATIADLQKQVLAKPTPVPDAPPVMDLDQVRKVLQTNLEAAMERFRPVFEECWHAFRMQCMTGMSSSMIAAVSDETPWKTPAPYRIQVEVRPGSNPPAPAGPKPVPPPSPPAASTGSQPAPRRALIALAQNPDGLRPRKLAILSEIQEGGSTWRGAFAGFRKAGHIEQDGELIRITRAGLQELGAYEPLPTGVALRNQWRAKIGGGPTRLAIFDAILEAYPAAVSAARVADRAKVELGGSTWRGHMAHLRGLELVAGSGELRASEDLFE